MQTYNVFNQPYSAWTVLIYTRGIVQVLKNCLVLGVYFFNSLILLVMLICPTSTFLDIIHSA